MRRPKFPASMLLERAIEVTRDRGTTFEAVASEVDVLAATLSGLAQPDAEWIAIVEAGRLRANMWTAQRFGRFDQAHHLFRARRSMMDARRVAWGGVSALQERVEDELTFAAYAFSAGRTHVAEQLCDSAAQAIEAVLDGRATDRARPAVVRQLLADVAGVRARRGAPGGDSGEWEGSP